MAKGVAAVAAKGGGGALCCLQILVAGNVRVDVELTYECVEHRLFWGSQMLEEERREREERGQQHPEAHARLRR